jgi:hypothetical protein
MKNQKDCESYIPWEKIFVRHGIHYFSKESIITSKEGIYIFPFYYFNIRDSIHFKALVNKNFDEYNDYLNAAPQFEHNEEKFKKLLNELDLNKMPKIELIQINNNFYIYDGLHRASILLYKDIFRDGIPSGYFKLNKSNEQSKWKKYIKKKLKILSYKLINFIFS